MSVSVLRAIWVSLRTVRFCFLVLPRVASSHVFQMRYRLQMARIDAGSVSAAMIQLLPFGHWALYQLICDHVRVFLFARSSNPETASIASVVLVGPGFADPEPARTPWAVAWRVIDQVNKTICERWLSAFARTKTLILESLDHKLGTALFTSLEETLAGHIAIVSGRMAA